MMFTTIGTWKRFVFATDVEQNRLRTCAAETRNDAHDLGDALGLAQQPTRIGGLHIQNWPLFFVLWQIIGCVSAYDSFLVMKYQEELEERNPLGGLLLYANGGDPAMFLAVKFLGTIMVLGILANLYHSRPQWGLAIAKGVAAFQICLLAYLMLN